MAKEVFIDLENFKKGFYKLEDTTKAPFGSLRIMKNATITDRGGISPRLGTELLGIFNSDNEKVKGFYNFRKSFGTDELLIKAHGTKLYAYSKNHPSAGWFVFKTGLTDGKEFGFTTSLVNTDNDDYVVGSNRFEPYFRWAGEVTVLDGAVSGSPSSITVESVLADEIYYSATATGSSATTLDVSGTPWAASQWVNFYVYIKSGTHVDKIRKITSNDTNTITFDTLGSDPGNAEFEIRRTAFPATGTIIYNGTEIAYTAIPEHNKFTVSSAHDADDGTAVALVIDEYPGNPRGNRLTNYLNRIIVGNVRSAMARGSGGALQGYSSAGSYFVSEVNDPTSFDFSAARVAGEGDIVSTPYGGGDITDVVHQEEDAYIFKKDYIEAVRYSQDSDDLAVRTPLKAGTGSIGKTIKGSDDVYFFTKDKKFTSLGRVAAKDIKPQTENIGSVIQRYLNDSGIDADVGRGKEFKDKIYLPIKSDSNTTDNDVCLVYSKANKSFEGIWDINAFALEEFDGELHYGESNSPNIYKMLTGHADVRGDDSFDIVSEVATHFINLTPSKADTQALNGLTFEGYIRGGTSITFQAFKDFSNDPFLEFVFASTESGLLDNENSGVFLGSAPLGVQPMGALSGEQDNDGRFHFQFRVYFPFQYGNYFSLGHKSSGVDIDYEIIRYGLALKEDVSVKTGRIKQVN